jgi:hypothetical protein
MLPQVSTNADTRFVELAQEALRRDGEALRLYRCMPSQLPFHLSKASERLIRGGVRSGKTTCAVAEFASAVTGIPLLDHNGNEIPFQYPRDEPLLTWVIGYNEKHIARIHRKLFRPGLFRILRDPVTKKWRSWQPWREGEVPREQTRPSPPLIPERFIKSPDGWAWNGKVQGCFELCVLKSGTEIHGMTSGGQAGKGEAVHIILIDEDIEREEHYDEWLSRLTDVRGRIIWAAWPQTVNAAMHNVSDRAQAQADRENPDVMEIILVGSENPFLPKDEVQKRLEAWGPEVSRSRDRGEFLTENQLVFPHFNLKVHGMRGSGCPKALADELQRLNYIPSEDWTNFLAVDPGTAHPAVLMMTIPPPKFGDHVVAFDEIYGLRFSPDELAQFTMSRYSCMLWDAFVIDEQFGRQVQFTSGKSSKQQLTEAFKRAGLVSARSGNGFFPGSPDTNGRNMILRSWMIPREDGTTKLIVVDHKTVWLQKQMRLYKLQVQRTEVMDKVVRKHSDLPDCGAYIAAFDPQWVPKAQYEKKEQSTEDWLEERYRNAGIPRLKNDRSCYLGAGTVSAAGAA